MTKYLLGMSLLLTLALSACQSEKTENSAENDNKPVASESVNQAATDSDQSAGEEVDKVALHPGKALHDANCISCHDSRVYTRDDRKVSDFPKLQAQVRRCDANLGTQLFDEELAQVTDFLNSTYYHFQP